MPKAVQSAPAFTLISAAATGAVAIAPDGAQHWRRDVNDRFGASAEVPGFGFVAEPPPAEDDGESRSAGFDVLLFSRRREPV